MSNDLLTKSDIVRGKNNFDALDAYLDGPASAQVALPSGKKIKTRAGVEKELIDKFPDGKAGLKDVGYSKGRVPLAEDTFKACYGSIDGYYSGSNIINVNSLEVGTRCLVHNSNTNSPNANEDGFFFIETIYSLRDGTLLQRAWGYTTGVLFTRALSGNIGEESWSPWRHAGILKSNYTTTTATAANVVVTSSGELQRSTSSRLFKEDINEIEMPDYRTALRAVQPISYRSTSATSDNTDWHWYSFIAEDIARIDPALVNMSSVEFFEDTDEDGNTFINTRELPEGEYAPDGLNLNGIVTLMTRINQYMLDDIEDLEKDKTQLKTRMTKLEKRLAELEERFPPS